MRIPVDYRLVLAFILVAVLAQPLGGQTVRDQMLVSGAWLQQHLDAVKVLHVGDRAGYDAGHIPGAVLVEMSSLLVQRDGIPNELPPVSALEGVFTGALRPADELRTLYERVGVSRESVNVVYCRTGMQASVTYFVLKYLGYDAVLYDGSYVEWSNAGEATE
jgi:3-mercaptopyruvate sulfurtransferase SseA